MKKYVSTLVRDTVTPVQGAAGSDWHASLRARSASGRQCVCFLLDGKFGRRIRETDIVAVNTIHSAMARRGINKVFYE
jgi:hypothetical protein